MNANLDHIPPSAYKYWWSSYYATEMRAIPNHKKTNLTINSNNKKRKTK